MLRLGREAVATQGRARVRVFAPHSESWWVGSSSWQCHGDSARSHTAARSHRSRRSRPLLPSSRRRRRYPRRHIPTAALPPRPHSRRCLPASRAMSRTNSGRSQPPRPAAPHLTGSRLGVGESEREPGRERLGGPARAGWWSRRLVSVVTTADSDEWVAAHSKLQQSLLGAQDEKDTFL